LGYAIKIHATDIDDKALNEARRGIYPHERIKNVKKEYLDKYFARENGRYRVRRNIRQVVIFGHQDLVSGAPISHLDLIICRNALIYFNAELQNRVVFKFHYALNGNGYIFFDKSEPMLAGSRLFLPINIKWRIFEKVRATNPAAGYAEDDNVHI
jgi:two-component system CheB/CheR fusion protein